MNTNKPAVSVILPTYNRSKTLERAINSVLKQTYSELELIIVDDASTDNTEEIVNAFMNRDGRVKYIKHSSNTGPAGARNTGIKMASGRYIGFQDSDDEWMPDKLEKQVKILDDSPSDTGMVYTSFIRIFPDKSIYVPPEKIRIREGFIHFELVNGNFIGMPTTLIKKECFDRVGLFDERLPPLEDWELFLRISKYFSISYIDKPLVTEFESEDSISKVKASNIKALRLILKKHYHSFKKAPKALARYCFMIGDFLYRSGDKTEAREYLKTAFRLRPTSSKYFMGYIMSFAGQGIYRRLL
jgi:glycosyltransferase involved in cell wall biosynthesis